jgi:hypothetical protein
MLMRKIAAFTLLVLAMQLSVLAGDHSADYKMGTFLSATSVEDGTITNTLHGDGTTIAGGVYANRNNVYKIKVSDGTWYVTTLRQNQDSMLRGMGQTPMHLKSEKANPLDGLKTGDQVLFRIHERRYLNGKFTQMAITYANNPDKEVEFSARFVPDIAQPQPTTQSNVKAMCEAGKLSPELRAKFCTVPTQDIAEQVKNNSEAGKSSPAAAAAMAIDGKQSTPQQMADLVAQGNASRCAIVTTPAGAEVFIDGNKGGITPFIFVLIKRDKPRIISIKMSGYKTVDKEIDPDGKTVPISLVLEKQ